MTKPVSGRHNSTEKSWPLPCQGVHWWCPGKWSARPGSVTRTTLPSFTPSVATNKALPKVVQVHHLSLQSSLLTSSPGQSSLMTSSPGIFKPSHVNQSSLQDSRVIRTHPQSSLQHSSFDTCSIVALPKRCSQLACATH